MRRSELKSIVKECIVEILSEGLGQTSQIIQGIPTQVIQPNFTENVGHHPGERKPPQQKRQNVPGSLREIAKRESGGDKVLESILADTAASTLPKMLQHEGKAPVRSSGGLYEKVVAESSPEELFGDEASSKWASLAFADSFTKK